MKNTKTEKNVKRTLTNTEALGRWLLSVLYKDGPKVFNWHVEMICQVLNADGVAGCCTGQKDPETIITRFEERLGAKYHKNKKGGIIWMENKQSRAWRQMLIGSEPARTGGIGVHDMHTIFNGRGRGKVYSRELEFYQFVGSLFDD